ncbi:Microfibrillar-associated protein 1 [Halotydeus destructor]|nr:Microfibrillar-associated protein 1 [Halotydeus destructor]
MASGNLSTAAAVPIKNAKGEIAMQKVKVQRYVTGKKPQYADDRALSSDESDEELADTIARRPENLESGRLLPNLAAVKLEEEEEEITPFSEDVIKSDRRLRRLIQRDGESSSSRRQIAEPEILALGEERRRPKRSEVESSDEELDEDNVERRHALLRQIKLEEEEEELHEKEHEGQSEDEDQESEYEEYTDSEDDMAPTRLKPVFTRKEQRITVLEKEKEEEAERLKDLKVKKEQEERRKYALKIIEDENKKEEQEKNEENDDAMLEASIAAVNTDDENEESSY